MGTEGEFIKVIKVVGTEVNQSVCGRDGVERGIAISASLDRTWDPVTGPVHADSFVCNAKCMGDAGSGWR